MGKKKIVTLSGNRSIKDIRKDLADSGFVVEQVLEDSGSIIGDVDAEVDVNRLKSIDGVADVEDLHEVGSGRPGSPDTW